MSYMEYRAFFGLNHVTNVLFIKLGFPLRSGWISVNLQSMLD